MKSSVWMVAAASAAALALSGSAAAAVVDITGLNGFGTILVLDAGTYTVGYAGIAGGGLWDAYSPWSFTSGCDQAGKNCSTGYNAPFAIDFGHGTGTFDRVDGFNYGLLPEPGDNKIYATAAQALAEYSTGDLAFAALPDAQDPQAYALVGGPVTFTLAAAQAVNFFILDNPYGDNRDGVSLSLTKASEGGGVPEPATWAMLILGFAGTGAVLRRRRVALTA